jgi:hypothetical protein
MVTLRESVTEVETPGTGIGKFEIMENGNVIVIILTLVPYWSLESGTAVAPVEEIDVP